MYDKSAQGDVIVIDRAHQQLKEGNGKLNIRVPKKSLTFTTRQMLTPRLVEIPFSGRLTHWTRNQSRIPSGYRLSQKELNF